MTIGSIFSLAGVTVTKLWVNNGRPIFFISAFLLYMLTTCFWMLTLKRERLVIAESVWSVLMMILTIMLGLLVFREKISIQEGIGMALAVLATLLLLIKF